MYRTFIWRLAIYCLLVISAPLLLACQPTGGPTASTQAPVMSMTELQAGLKRLGLYKGAVDGISGPKTRAAIRAFERSNRMPETGQPSRDLELRLRVALNDGSEDGAGPQAQQRSGASLTEARRIVRDQFWPAKLTEVDLNNDGLMDVIAAAEYSSRACGVQACSHMVLINRGSRYEVVVENALAVELTAAGSRTRGYRDLRGLAHGAVPFIAKWDGRKYAYSG
ncbi:MAG: peptidoglycan-binding protein [Paracoccaceae bacterium]